MSQGYSLSLVEDNRRMNQRHLGVALGRVCIKWGVPVTDVADYFGVSRQAIYNWFRGVSHPRSRMAPEIKKYMDKIGQKLG